MAIRTCANKECKMPFPPKKPWQRFHCRQCRDRYHNLLRQAILKKARA
jgi:hypothetical protein